MEKLNELYERYGRLLIEAEILQGKINECKHRIAEEMNKPQSAPPQEQVEEAK